MYEIHITLEFRVHHYAYIVACLQTLQNVCSLNQPCHLSHGCMHAALSVGASVNCPRSSQSTASLEWLKESLISLRYRSSFGEHLLYSVMNAAGVCECVYMNTCVYVYYMNAHCCSTCVPYAL